jgi:hypothetical protein
MDNLLIARAMLAEQNENKSENILYPLPNNILWADAILDRPKPGLPNNVTGK